MAEFSNKITGGLRSVPLSQRQRVRVLQMLDVKSTDVIPNGSTLVWNSAIENFELLPYGGSYGSKYDATQIFTVSPTTTNYNVKTSQTTLWSSITTAKYAKIIVTGGDVTLRFNSITNDGYPMKVSESPFEIALMDISNIFITTAAASADVKILLIGD